MKKFLAQFVFLLIVIGLSLFIFGPASGTKRLDLPFLPQKTSLATLEVGEKVFKVEIADTQGKRTKGLSERENKPEDQGMLFIFESVDKYPFWMKGLKFPLDFIWIKDDLVVDILPNVPPPSEGQSDVSLPIYQPRVEVNKVLEINGGIAEKLGLKIGDKIKLKQ